MPDPVQEIQGISLVKTRILGDKEFIYKIPSNLMGNNVYGWRLLIQMKSKREKTGKTKNGIYIQNHKKIYRWYIEDRLLDISYFFLNDDFDFDNIEQQISELDLKSKTCLWQVDAERLKNHTAVIFL